MMMSRLHVPFHWLLPAVLHACAPKSVQCSGVIKPVSPCSTLLLCIGPACTPRLQASPAAGPQHTLAVCQSCQQHLRSHLYCILRP